MKELFKSYGQEQLFKEVATKIIDEEEKKSNIILASSLRRALGEADSNNKVSEKILRPLPSLPREKSEYLEEIRVQKTRQEIVLSPENLRVMSGLLKEYSAGNEIRRFGLNIRSKLLFCGPPGCGKTLCAEVFAGELGLPLYVVKLDKLISSYLGETAANVRKVFDFAKTHPCVLFFDEFDAIARTRTDDRESGEVRRVVNSLLLFIDQMVPKGFLIAATNLDDVLDSAIWRRFDEIVWFEKPNLSMISKFLKNKLKNLDLCFDPLAFSDRFLGYSYSELERVCHQAIKLMIIDRKKVLSESYFLLAIDDEERRRLRRK